MSLALGIDIGTSGVRTAVIDDAGEPVAMARVEMARVEMAAPARIDGRPGQDPEIWWAAVEACLDAQATELRRHGRAMAEIGALAVDGTSGTLVLVDRKLRPVTPGLMYDSAGFDAAAEAIARVAPSDSIARGSGSALARLLFLQTLDPERRARYAQDQAGWVAARLMAKGGRADESNVLKLGYDPEQRCWPDWLRAAGVRIELLPEVHPVGAPLGRLDRAIARRFGFREEARVVAGTTDSNAAFLASGADHLGDGVTSLGTTLAIKLLTDRPVTDPARGIYSHRLETLWLAGGASNSGGGVLLAHFAREDLERMAGDLDPDQPTGLDYYPLTRPGERFPVSDPHLAPRLTPRPASDVAFYQGLLEGIANIEQQGYAALADLGCPPVRRVFSAGGGAQNAAWTRIRARTLGVPLVAPTSEDAAIGTARIAAGRLTRV